MHPVMAVVYSWEGEGQPACFIAMKSPEASPIDAIYASCCHLMLYSALLRLSAPSYVPSTAKKAQSLHCTHYLQTLLRHVSKLNHLAAPESLQSVTHHRMD